MAIKDFYPAIRPTLDLNFAGSRTVDPRITFTRASTATYFDEFGVMRTALANVPRIDFDPATGECKGLLIEEQRTNLLTYSQQFDNAAWVRQGTSPNNSTVLSNAAVAPDGTLTADKLIEMPSAAGSGMHGVYRFYAVPSGAITLSFYVKAAERYIVRLSAYEGGVPANPVGAYFNLSTGSVTSTSGLTTNATITPVGNDWYRCAVSGVSAGTTSSWSVDPVRVSGQSSYTGDGTSGIYIWGAQIETGNAPTSYIPTTTAQVTRAADAASMTGTNFSKWYKPEEGTLLVDYRRNSNKASGNQIPFVVSDGTTNNIIAITDSANGLNDRVLVVVGGVNQASLGSVDYTENQQMIRSIGYKKDDVSTSVNGSSAASDDLVLIPSVNRLDIGYASYFLASRINGYISRLSYYPKRLSNTNLQALAA